MSQFGNKHGVNKHVKFVPAATQSRTQSLQPFWSVVQRREDSVDIEKIQFF